MSSIFTRIIKGEIGCHKIAEDAHCVAFLDINPNTEGHTLCVPKKEVDNLFDLDNTTYIHLMSFCKKVAYAIERGIPCNRVGLAVVGIEVPHAHVHLIPINGIEDMSFQKKVSLTEEQLGGIAKRIKANFYAD